MQSFSYLKTPLIRPSSSCNQILLVLIGSTVICFSVHLKQLLTFIINLLLSIEATFAFGFIASQYAFPSVATVCNTKRFFFVKTCAWLQFSLFYLNSYEVMVGLFFPFCASQEELVDHSSLL